MKTWLVIRIPKGESLADQRAPTIHVATAGDGAELADDVFSHAVLELDAADDQKVEEVIVVDLEGARRYTVDVSPTVSVISSGSV